MYETVVTTELVPTGERIAVINENKNGEIASYLLAVKTSLSSILQSL